MTIPRGSLGPRRQPRRIETESAFPADVLAQVCIHLKPGKDGAVRVEKELLDLSCEGLGSLSVTIQDEACTVGRGGADTEFRLAELLTAGRLGDRRRGEPLRELGEWTKALEHYFDPGSLVEDEEHRFLRLLSRPRFFTPFLDTIANACQVRRLRLDATALRADSPARGAMGPAGENLAAAVTTLRGLREKPKKQFIPILAALQDIFPRVDDVKPVRVQPGRLALSFGEDGVAVPFGQESVSDGILHSRRGRHPRRHRTSSPQTSSGPDGGRGLSSRRGHRS